MSDTYTDDLKLWRAYLNTGDLKYIRYISQTNFETFYRQWTGQSYADAIAAKN